MVSSFSGFIDPTPRRSKDLHVNPEANQIGGNGSMTERFDVYKMLLRRQLLVLEGGFKPRQFSAQPWKMTFVNISLTREARTTER